MKNFITSVVLLLSTLVYSQIDSTYYQGAKTVLEKYPKSKITAEHLYESAKITYDEYNIVVPYKLAIAQAIIETSLGNTGVGKRNNPFSINSKKGYITFNSIQDGVSSYYRTIARNYLKFRSVDKLLINFVNGMNRRYAVSKLYESRLRKVYNRL